MKSYQLILLLFFYSSSSAQWQWSNPQPSGYPNNSVVSVDAQNSFIINANGDLIRTNNQGSSWYVQENLPFGRAIAYKDSTMAVAAFASVYISKDLGQSWEKHSVNQQEFFNVQIISRDTIMLTGVFPANPSHILLSTDRGISWQLINPDIILKNIWMFTAKVGFATSYNYIYKTINGGQTWLIPDSTAPGGGTCLKFYDQNHGVVFAGSKFWRTVDGGLHWTASASSIGVAVYFIEFIDLNTLIAAGEGGLIYRSADNGITWSASNYVSVNPSGFYAGCFTNSTTGFIVGHRGSILKTTDAGMTWNQYAPTYIDVTALDFINDSIGFAATRNNIFKKRNSITGWTKLNSISTTGIFDVFRYIHFFSTDTGIAISQSPVKVFKTYNSGTNWQEIPLNILYNDEVYDAFAIDRTIYMSTNGAYGRKILRSLNAGESWTTQYLSAASAAPYFTDLFFIDGKTGYGTYGYYVYKTIDSARTWNQLTMRPVQLLKSVWFSNPATGFAVGDQSHIIKTTDSGQTWTELHIDPNNYNIPGNMQQVRFFDSKIGFVTVGNKVYRTVNAGNTWTLHGNLPWDLTGIEIADSTLYMYGIYGSILKRSIKTFEIDSLRFDSLTSCSTKLSATISATYSIIDSIGFQYGISGFSNTVNAAPFTINDTALKVNAMLSSLSSNTNYMARVKIFFQGNYYFSNSITFVTGSMSLPTITINGGTLFSSSATGNQWYFNNTAIAGAIQNNYTPTQSGSYALSVTVNGCISNLSPPFSFLVTGINNVQVPDNIKIYPNPAARSLMVQNNQLKNLEIKIFSITGVELQRLTTSKKENMFDLSLLPQGTYLMSIKEAGTLKSMRKIIIKL
jgi:photosystem II stability/assembly factor-like uncharacterized protein